jgi:hypothetical protein
MNHTFSQIGNKGLNALAEQASPKSKSPHLRCCRRVGRRCLRGAPGWKAEWRCCLMRHDCAKEAQPTACAAIMFVALVRCTLTGSEIGLDNRFIQRSPHLCLAPPAQGESMTYRIEVPRSLRTKESLLIPKNSARKASSNHATNIAQTNQN